jgi:hypothetical protein
LRQARLRAMRGYAKHPTCLISPRLLNDSSMN